MVILVFVTARAYNYFALRSADPTMIPINRSLYLSKFDITQQQSISVPCGFTTDRLRIRASASINSEVLDVLPVSTNVCFTETVEVEGDEWGKLRDSGYYPDGWVFLRFVDIDPVMYTASQMLVDKDPSAQCLYDKYKMEVVTPQLVAINRQYTNITLEELAKIDVVMSETMGVELIPAIAWWIKYAEIPLTRPFTRGHEENWEGFQTEWTWDGCNLVEITTGVIALTVVVAEYGETNALGTYLHERAHSLHAVHGRDALAVGVKLDADIVGPGDAYWWSKIGKSASMGTCRLYDIGSLEYKTCSSISTIIN